MLISRLAAAIDAGRYLLGRLTNKYFNKLRIEFERFLKEELKLWIYISSVYFILMIGVYAFPLSFPLGLFPGYVLNTRAYLIVVSFFEWPLNGLVIFIFAIVTYLVLLPLAPYLKDIITTILSPIGAFLNRIFGPTK